MACEVGAASQLKFSAVNFGGLPSFTTFLFQQRDFNQDQKTMNSMDADSLSDYSETQSEDGPKLAQVLSKTIPVPEIDPHWINLDTVQAWIKECDDKHNCLDFEDFGSAPTWLIDVEQECLTSPASLPGRTRYCALSYVWGRVETSKLTQASEQAFCLPGAFSADSIEVVIPRTVLHAIKLVKALGEKYLWVDSLCTLQDDRTHLNAELRNMGAIYNGAILTIVAATGWDANEGLRGLKGISQRRQLAGNFADDLNKYTNPEHMIWNSRGWTFQEREFSRRMILFSGQTLLWFCSACLINEAGNVSWGKIRHNPDGVHPGWKLLDQLLKPARDKADESDSDIIDAGASPESVRSAEDGKEVDAANLDRELEIYFCDIVSHINIRNFSYMSDLPLAFDGIAFYLTQTASPKGLFSNGLTWGLPLAHFLYALTWSNDGEDLRPRGVQSHFPSWSWFAWEGAVTARPRSSNHSAFSFERISKVRPICDYGFTESPALGSPLTGEGGRYLRITAEKFVTSPKRWHSDAINIYLIDHVWPFRFAMLYPDQLVDFEREQKSIDLVGIATFEGTYDATATKRLTFVKALWISRGKADVRDEYSSYLFYRKGVAIIQKDLWDAYAIKIAERSTVTLA